MIGTLSAYLNDTDVLALSSHTRLPHALNSRIVSCALANQTAAKPQDIGLAAG